MTTRTKAAGERGNRHLSGKHKVHGTREKTPAVAHVSDLSAPNFTLPDARFWAEAAAVRARLDAVPVRDETFAEARRAEREAQS